MAARAAEQVNLPPPLHSGFDKTVRYCSNTQEINDRTFAYDDNNRAHIADPDAGTYRELVLAAETCQVAVIHRGKPRNPDEPGLEELTKRADPFL